MFDSIRADLLPKCRSTVWTLTPASWATSSREISEKTRAVPSSKRASRIRVRVSSTACARAPIVYVRFVFMTVIVDTNI